MPSYPCWIPTFGHGAVALNTWATRNCKTCRVVPLNQSLWLFGGDAHKDEIDVLARFAGQFLALECKVGKQVKPAYWHRQISSVAEHCLGRFSIPLLVVPRLARPAREEGRGLWLDLSDLNSPDLPLRLEEFQSKRRV